MPIPQDVDVRYGCSSTVIDTELALVKPASGAGVMAVSISPQSPLGLFGCFWNSFGHRTAANHLPLGPGNSRWDFTDTCHKYHRNQVQNIGFAKKTALKASMRFGGMQLGDNLCPFLCLSFLIFINIHSNPAQGEITMRLL